MAHKSYTATWTTVVTATPSKKEIFINGRNCPGCTARINSAGPIFVIEGDHVEGCLSLLAQACQQAQEAEDES